MIGITEFAKLIGLNVRTVRHYVRQGKLIPAYRDEKLWSFFNDEQVTDFKEKREARLKDIKERKEMFKVKKYKLSDLAREIEIPYGWLWYLKLSGRLQIPVTDYEKEQIKQEWTSGKKGNYTRYGQA